MSELPYQVDRAKTGKASCKGCKQKIEKGVLRLAVMVKSAFFDGNQANWYHIDCFPKKQCLQSINDIGNFNILDNEDQKKIKDFIVEENKDKVEGKKRRSTDMPDGNVSALKNFHVEYSKSSRATCQYCDLKICKGEVRVSNIDFNTDIGRKHGGVALWHHLKCFSKTRHELLYFANGENLPGFELLKKEDQDIIKTEIRAIKSDEVPVKKLKTEVLGEDELKAVQEKEKKMEVQNILFQEYRTALRKLKIEELHDLLECNLQQIPQGKSEYVDRLAECMAFGALQPCPECKQGQLVLDTLAYKCTGHTQWTKCTHTTQNPKRTTMKIPDQFLKNPIFSNYKPKVDVRIFHAAPFPNVTVKAEPSTSVKREVPIPPLKNLQFFMYGRIKNKEETKCRIVKLGGQVVSKLTDTTVAVISTKKDVEKMPDKMKEIKEKDIGVVDVSFLDSIDTEKGTIATSLQVVKDNNIANWGSDPATRLSQEVLGGKSISNSATKKTSSDSTVNLKIYDGTAVDPASELQDVARVYVDETGVKFSVVLVKSDVVTKKNSFYKIQLLVHNDETIWIFRSWGRIGTSAGGNKLVQSRGPWEGECAFQQYYKEKTNCPWGEKCVKQPGYYYPIDVDYTVEALELQTDPNSDLPETVQQFVKKIFDINVMKQIMLEFELDTEKMPLGKLTKNQIKSGYETLSELQNLIKEGNASQNQIVDATNRFFTFIPHNFGANNAPLLDNIEIIKMKTEMLDNLFEIEIAYNLLESDIQDSTSRMEDCYKKLKADIAPLDNTTDEYLLISEYVNNTHAKTHSSYTIEIEQVFKVVRLGEEDRYSPYRELHNRRLLWHGSRATNFAGILSEGLRIAPPEAPVTGYMFGKGIYFADMVSKSANYCATSKANPVGFLLLCEVALGDMKICHEAEQVRLPAGTHSAWGVGRTQPDPLRARTLPSGVLVPLGAPTPNPLAKPGPRTLLYNEFIVYDVAQVNVKYLVQIKFNYRD